MPVFIFLCILVFNVIASYWIAANPDFIVLVGQFVDVYVMPGVLALGFSIFAFWLWAKLNFLANRMQHEFGERRE